MRRHSRTIITRRQLTDSLCSLHCSNGAITLAEPQHFGATMVPLEEKNTIRLSKLPLPTDAQLKCLKNSFKIYFKIDINPLKPELNPICYLLTLLGAHHFLYVSRIRVKLLTFRRLMSYIYMEHPFLMFLDHTQRRSTVGRTPLDE